MCEGDRKGETISRQKWKKKTLAGQRVVDKIIRMGCDRKVTLTLHVVRQEAISVVLLIQTV